MSNLVRLSCVDWQCRHEQKAGIQRFEYVENTSKHWNWSCILTQLINSLSTPSTSINTKMNAMSTLALDKSLPRTEANEKKNKNNVECCSQFPLN